MVSIGIDFGFTFSVHPAAMLCLVSDTLCKIETAAHYSGGQCCILATQGRHDDGDDKDDKDDDEGDDTRGRASR